MINYFVNVRIETRASGMGFMIYELHSGPSQIEIMSSIIESVRNWAGDTIEAAIALSDVDPSGSISEIENNISEIIDSTMVEDDECYVESYSLTIGQPYEAIDMAFKFYKEFKEERDALIDNYEDMEINFYGDIAGRFERGFERVSSYLDEFTREYKVVLSNNFLKRMLDII